MWVFSIENICIYFFLMIKLYIIYNIIKIIMWANECKEGEIEVHYNWHFTCEEAPVIWNNYNNFSKTEYNIEVKEKPKLNWVVTINDVSTWFLWNDWYLYFSKHSDIGDGSVKANNLILYWVEKVKDDISKVKIPEKFLWNNRIKIMTLSINSKKWGIKLFSTTGEDDRTWELWQFVKYHDSVHMDWKIIHDVWEYKKTNIWSVWDSWSPVYDRNWNTIWLISWESAVSKNVYVSFF